MRRILPSARLLSWSLATTLTITLSGVVLPISSAMARTIRAYIGTYTPAPGTPVARTRGLGDFSRGRGIYLLEFDEATGTPGVPRLVAETPAASWLVIDASRDLLFAANEWRGGPDNAGTVTAFRIDRGSGGLTPINVQAVGGTPVSLALTPSGRHLLAANYGGGTVAMLPVANDGSLGPVRQLLAATPVGLSKPPSPTGVPSDAPAVMHMVAVDPTGGFVLANESVGDRVYVWRLNEEAGRLVPNNPPWFDVPRGTFPRHFVISPGGRHLYNLGERSRSIVISDLTYVDDDVRLTVTGSAPTLPPDFRGVIAASELLITRDGRSLYAAMRYHNSIAAFRRQRNGALTPIGDVSTQNDHPRTLALSPDERFVFALNHRGNSITVFSRNVRSGTLRYTKQAVDIDSPASIAFLP